MEWAGPRSGTRVPAWRLPGVRAAPGSLRAAWPVRFEQAPGSRGTPCPEAGSRAAGEMGLHGCGGASQVPTAHGAQTKATPARSSGPQVLQTQDWDCSQPLTHLRSLGSQPPGVTSPPLLPARAPHSNASIGPVMGSSLGTQIHIWHLLPMGTVLLGYLLEVCELPQSGHRRRHWNTDIEERRQLALESPSPEKSILQTVSWLLSDGMDKDVLLPPMCLTAPRPARVSLTALQLSVLGACGASNSPPS